jgi:hypothetical protein
MKPVRSAWHSFPDVVIAAQEAMVKTHPCYKAAKTGDAEAADDLVRDVLKPDAVSAILRLAGGRWPTLVSAHAVEESGRNAIPQAIATHIGEQLGWPVDESVVQTNIVNHTGADGYARLGRPALFDGIILPGAIYLLVDDFVGQGGTLANLRGYIESNGGVVIGAMALTGKPYSARLAVTDFMLESLRQKHEQLESWWRDKFGYGFESLTESEARYLERSSDADLIRNRILEAEQGTSDPGNQTAHGADERAGDVRTLPSELKCE